MTQRVPELTKTEGLARPYSLCGRRCYLMGFQDGSFPDYGWHTLDEMGGVWTHPIKIADGLWISVDPKPEDERAGHKPSWSIHMHKWLGKCDEFALGDGGAWAEHRYDLPEFTVVRREFVPADEAAVGFDIRVTAKDNAPRTIQLNVLVRFDILPVWFSEWPNPLYLEAEQKDGKIVVHGVSDYMLPVAYSRWTAALGTDTEPFAVALGETLRGPEKTAGNGISALLKYRLPLDPTGSVRVVLAGDLYGEAGAMAAVERVLADYDGAERNKIALLQDVAFERTVIETPETKLDDCFLWSKLNLEWMMQTSPCLGTGAVAGHLDFPWYFGVDTNLSTGGFLAAGMHEAAKDALRILTVVGKKNRGRIPHELVTSGGVYSWGHIAETCHFEKAVWETYLWSGDEDFLKEMYPICRAGMLDYVLSQPCRDGIMLLEHEDKPDSKRNKICPQHLVTGFRSVARMAERLGDDETAQACRDHAEHFLKQIEELFWMEDLGYYAGWLDEDNKPRVNRDVPLKKQMHPGIFEGIAYDAICDRSRVERALSLFEDPCYTNTYGLYFDNDKAFNMPISTGCAAVAEFNYGRTEPGMNFIRMMERTLGYTMPGAMPEYITADGDPEKANPQWCYLQLWSAATYLEGLVLGLLYLKPDAARGKVSLTPRLPRGWPGFEVRNLVVGGTRFSVRVDGAETTVTHLSGPKLDINILKAEN